jgi:phosphonate transport system substrate-binding protein
MRRAVMAGAAVLAGVFLLLAYPGSPLQRHLLSFLVSPSWPPPLPWANPSPPPLRPVLRVAIGAMVSPERTFSSYRQLFAVLADRLGLSLELVQRPTYADVNALLDKGEVEVAWICTGAWPELARSGGARLLVVPVVNGETTYRAYVIVGRSCRADSFAELAGSRFVFSDPLSLTGYRYPTLRAAQLSQAAKTFFADTFFAHSHDNAIEAVRRGLADAASVDGLVFDYLARTSPQSVAGLRVVERSEPYPIPPVVVSSRLAGAEAERVAAVLLSLHSEPEGRQLLADMGVDRFVRPAPDSYQVLP